VPPPRRHELYSKLAQAFRSAPPRPLVSCPHLLRAGSARRRRRREAVNDRTTGSQDLSCNGMRRRRRSDTSTRRDGTARRHPARVRGVLLGRVARPTTTKKNRSVPSCWPAGGPEIPSSESSGRGQVECGETNKTFGKPREASAEREVREQRSG
jgi:hypothetical protein